MHLVASVLALGLFSENAHAMGKPRPKPPSGSIASDVRIAYPSDGETCHQDFVYQAPASFAEAEGRLAAPLRQVAQESNPLAALFLSAKSFALQDAAHALAYADLSVTGRNAFQRFRALHEAGLLTEATLSPFLEGDPALAGLGAQAFHDASAMALDRAYRVANTLPYGSSPDRADLGWVAVSGEDDEPYRPVNASSAPYPQYDLTVAVGRFNVSTRYMIAEGLKGPQPAPSARSAGRTLPEAPRPSLSSDAKVLLFVHGMDSRLEEAMSLVDALRAISARTGENWTIIAMDLPTSGYATQLDHLSISPLTDIGNPKFLGFDAHGHQNVPILDFMEEFVVEFVETLNRQIPLKDRLQAVIGGSLGGNLTFRMGRRTDLPWLRNVVTWSPASIWTGLADGGDPFKQLAVSTGWKRAGGDAGNLNETPDKRASFFSDAFNGAINIGPIQIVPAQPSQWYRQDWPCFANAIQSSRLQRQETYNRNFRLWHWRLGTEQLIYSQQQPPDKSYPRYLDNRVRMLLATGSKDNFNFTNIYDSTRQTAHRMVNTPGRAILVQDTGHSIHSERPNFFAGRIVEFLR
jgi:pimeloyl-ACP methyl ester carboxylesterase